MKNATSRLQVFFIKLLKVEIKTSGAFPFRFCSVVIRFLYLCN